MKQRIRTLFVVAALIMALGTHVYAAGTGNVNKSDSTVETATNADGNPTTIIKDKNGNTLVIEDLGDNFDEDDIELEPDEETDAVDSDQNSQFEAVETKEDNVEAADSLRETEKKEETALMAEEKGEDNTSDSTDNEEVDAAKSQNPMPIILAVAAVLVIVFGIRLKKR